MSNNDETFARLITAFHVLHRHGVLNEFGSISIRNPLDSSTFFNSTAPAVLVSSRNGISEWNVTDGSPKIDTSLDLTTVQQNPSISEQFIHSCIYDHYPGVRSIVHAQSKESIVYGLCDAGGSMLNPVSGKAGFIGDFTPIFDPVQHGEDVPGLPRHNLLVNSKLLGDNMAQRLSYPRNDHDTEPFLPEFSITFIRGNGMALCAESLDEAVYRAIQVQRNAEAQTAAILQRSHSNIEIVYLSPEEMVGAQRISHPSIDTVCVAWAAEVYRTGLYRNDLLLNMT